MSLSTEELLQFARREAAQKGIKLENASSRSFRDNVVGFYHAVSWSQDLWIWGIFALQAASLYCVIATRKERPSGQLACFLGVSFMCAGASTLNGLGHKHWNLFSTQNYFDKHGVFISVIYTGPLLLILMVQLVLIVKELFRVAVTAGKLKIKNHQRKQQEAKMRKTK